MLKEDALFQINRAIKAWEKIGEGCQRIDPDKIYCIETAEPHATDPLWYLVEVRKSSFRKRGLSCPLLATNNVPLRQTTSTLLAARSPLVAQHQQGRRQPAPKKFFDWRYIAICRLKEVALDTDYPLYLGHLVTKKFETFIKNVGGKI